MANDVVTDTERITYKNDMIANYLNKLLGDLRIDLNGQSAGEYADDHCALLSIGQILVDEKYLYIDDDGEFGPEPAEGYLDRK